MNEGPHFSPDGGKCWIKGKRIYWENGLVFNINQHAPARLMPLATGEDYSKWTPAKRRRVLAESKARWKKHEAELRKQQKLTESLRKSAMAKLTPEEIRACDLDS